MKNGRVYKGKVILQTLTKIVIITRKGRKTLHKKRIRRISYDVDGPQSKKLHQKRAKRKRHQARARRKRLAARKKARAKRRELARKQAAEQRKKREEKRRIAAEKRRQPVEKRKIIVAEKIPEKKQKEEKALTQAEEKRVTALLKRQAEERRKKEAVVKKPAEKKRHPVEITRMGAVWRSALLPGWGQWKQDRKWSGALYGGAILAGGLGLYNTNREFINARRDLGNMNNIYSNGALLTAALGSSLVPSARTLENPVAAWLYDRPFDEQRKRVDAHYRKFQGIGLGLLAIYLWNVIDAYVFHESGSRASGLGSRDSGFWVRVSNHESQNPVHESRNLGFKFAMSWRF